MQAAEVSAFDFVFDDCQDPRSQRTHTQRHVHMPSLLHAALAHCKCSHPLPMLGASKWAFRCLRLQGVRAARLGCLWLTASRSTEEPSAWRSWRLSLLSFPDDHAGGRQASAAGRSSRCSRRRAWCQVSRLYAGARHRWTPRVPRCRAAFASGSSAARPPAAGCPSAAIRQQCACACGLTVWVWCRESTRPPPR